MSSVPRRESICVTSALQQQRHLDVGLYLLVHKLIDLLVHRQFDIFVHMFFDLDHCLARLHRMSRNHLQHPLPSPPRSHASDAPAAGSSSARPVPSCPAPARRASLTSRPEMHHNTERLRGANQVCQYRTSPSGSARKINAQLHVQGLMSRTGVPSSRSAPRTRTMRLFSSTSTTRRHDSPTGFG